MEFLSEGMSVRKRLLSLRWWPQGEQVPLPGVGAEVGAGETPSTSPVVIVSVVTTLPETSDRSLRLCFMTST